jgi:hypothetical protein
MDQAATDSAPAPAPAAAPVPVKRKRGRQLTYTREKADLILHRMAHGETLSAICRCAGMPDRTTFWSWCDAGLDDLPHRYAQARTRQADSWADQIMAVANDSSADKRTVEKDGREVEVIDHENINRSRLKVDSMKWLMSKLHPRQYGERIDGNVTLQAGDSLTQLMGQIRAAQAPVIELPPASDNQQPS